MELAGRVALVTGTTSGIGRATAIRLGVDRTRRTS
jgi:NAD(P)-dependent dehydrogenase (short-subunit alcohol dehydrogenase family)